MDDYKLMKTFEGRVKNVKVFSSRTAFRRYMVAIWDRFGDIHNVYTNHKPTIKELKRWREERY